MRKLNSMCTRVLLSWAAFSCITLAAQHTELVTTQVMLPKLAAASSWQEVEQLCDCLVASFTTAQETTTHKRSELYAALVQDCAEYHQFFKNLMVNAETQACLYVPKQEQLIARKKGYSSATVWAKQKKSKPFFDWYACYWQVHATNLVYCLADAQVAFDAADRMQLYKKAKAHLSCLEISFYYLQTTVYERAYRKLLLLYRTLVKQTRQGAL